MLYRKRNWAHIFYRWLTVFVIYEYPIIALIEEELMSRCWKEDTLRNDDHSCDEEYLTPRYSSLNYPAIQYTEWSS